MDITQDSADLAVLTELGTRLSRYRLNSNQTQAALAEEAGVSKRTLIRIEQGESVQLTSLIRVLRVLKLLPNIEALVPAPAASPLQQVRMHGKRRQRASSPTHDAATPKPWSWGDEE